MARKQKSTLSVRIPDVAWTYRSEPDSKSHGVATSIAPRQQLSPLSPTTLMTLSLLLLLLLSNESPFSPPPTSP